MRRKLRTKCWQQIPVTCSASNLTLRSCKMGAFNIANKVILAATYFIAVCLAIEFTSTEIDISPGEPFTLSWADANGPVVITLLTGPSTNIKPVEVIYSGSGNSYIWTPPNDLPSGLYAFSIEDDENLNYSVQWPYEAGDTASGGTSSSPSSTIRTTTTTPTPTPEPEPEPEPAPTTNTRRPTTTMQTMTTTQVTSAQEETSSTSTRTAESSTSPEPTPTGDDSEQTSLSSEATSSTVVIPSPSESSNGQPSDSTPDSASNTGESTAESQNSTASGLSLGAKVGIGIGAGVIGIILAVLAGFLIYRRGKAAGKRDVDDSNNSNSDLKPELGGNPVYYPELGGQGRVEMGGDPRLAELWHGNYDEWRRQPNELDGSPHSYRGADVGKT
ncbi:hypothetical protein F5B22DRAFT_73510 [Xylaria bambusicola]|uniref:uncharacterized protein n=1 Tax=Xylaria bambusicola TaxID=326684 RepID=UPI002008A064|nr:uncharacterized protein F5B22DRAFT_73510 [Xylaria bambusicola]KAI0518150.1 hypothetical protein F5B22DRAFT_73510 [Xylaria bambusicola]